MPVAVEHSPNKISLEELSEKLQDLQPVPPSHELERWLVGAGLSVDQAEKNFRKSLEWRNKAGADYILDWTSPQVLNKYYPGGFAGYDPSSCPVWLIPFGGADMRGMLSCVRKEEFVDFTIQIIEKSMANMRQKTKELNTPVTQHIFIFDLEGFSLSTATHTPTLDILQRLISIYEANYPETLKAAYVLNAPKVFQIVFRIVKGAVEQKTLSKIQVFGTEDWKEPLSEAVGLGVLPAKWGGTNSSADICMGDQVPENTKNLTSPEELPGMAEVNSANVAAGAVFTLRYTFSEETKVEWKFRSEGGDIGFSIQKKLARLKNKSGSRKGKNSSGKLKKKEESFDENPDASPEDVIDLTRVRSHKEIISGRLKCEAGFTYLLHFDNSHSMFRSKRLQYGINLQGPQQEEATLEKGKREVRELGEVVTCVTDMLEVEQKTRVA